MNDIMIREMREDDQESTYARNARMKKRTSEEREVFRIGRKKELLITDNEKTSVIPDERKN